MHVNRGIEFARDWLEIYSANENAADAGDPSVRETVSAHRPVFLRAGSSLLPPFPPLRHVTHSVEREAEPTAFTAAQKSEGIAAPEGCRCKISSVRRVGARSPPSHRNKIAHLKSGFIRGLGRKAAMSARPALAVREEQSLRDYAYRAIDQEW
jgi:hypothetical protein